MPGDLHVHTVPCTLQARIIARTERLLAQMLLLLLLLLRRRLLLLLVLRRLLLLLLLGPRPRRLVPRGGPCPGFRSSALESFDTLSPPDVPQPTSQDPLKAI